MHEKPRQRRPAFDREQGIAIAQALFHQRGFDAVSLADLTEAMNIKPPSFYAAYGSKAELFERAMHRYAGENALPMDKLLAPDRAPAEALTALLVAAAVAGWVASTTERGGAFWQLIKGSRTEIRKVVWPTRQETTQTTLIVVVFVFIMALILWGIDSVLGWLVGMVIG